MTRAAGGWHGWQREGQPFSLHIGKVPGGRTKRIALYAVCANEFVAEMEPLAWFTSEAAAKRALAMLDMFIRPRGEGSE